MRNKILTDLFTSKEFNNCISKMQPVNLQEDLKAEVGLILCELPESRLQELADKNELKFFTVRIVLNLIKSFNSPFYKKFRKDKAINIPIEDILRQGITDTIDQIDTQVQYTGFGPIQKLVMSATRTGNEYDYRADIALAEINNLYWYDKEMLMLYLKHGNYRAIEKETGIPWESAYKSIQKACKEIRNKIQTI